MDLSSLSTKNVPKMALSTLDIKNNYYVIKTGLVFNYYPIKVKGHSPTDNIIRFEKTPPVLMEGYAIVDKVVYRVTPKDLMRQVIRKSREVASAKREKVNGNSGKQADRITEDLVQHPDQPSVNETTEVEISEIADSTWEEQVGSLLDFISEKEGIEYEISDPAQS